MMSSLFLNNPEPMVKVRVMTVKDYAERTLKTLHKVGALHVEEGEELTPVDRAAIERERGEVNKLLTFVDNVLSYLPSKERITIEEDIEVIYTRPFSEISDEVKLLHDKTSKIHDRITRLDGEAQRLRQLKRYLEPLAKEADFRLSDLDFSGDYLSSIVIAIQSESYKALYERLKDRLLEAIAVEVEDETVLYIIAKAADQKTVESMVTDAGGNVLQIPDKDIPLTEFIESASNIIHSIEEELSKLGKELQNKVKEDLKRTVLLREALSAENERLSVLEKASEAKYVTLVEGWIPESNVELVISEVRESIGYVFIDTKEPAPVDEPPTKMKNLTGFKPFQVIINLFGVPKYREWDPTPVVAYSFALFFGLMVCDVIYALGLMLLARWLLKKFVDDPESENFKLFQRLIYICSGVALVGGLLTGQYLGDIYVLFGLESFALAPGVQEALQDPVMFILIALGIGFIHVNIGHIIAFAKGIKEKNRGLVLSKIGLFAVQIGLPAILHSLLRVEIPGFTPEIYSILLYVMLVGVILIVISSIMQSGGLGAIMWLFDITGLLGDVMSYARLAGVGLATFYLASTFNMMSGLFGEMIPGLVGVIMGVIIVIFGHAINMLLTSITGFMHSLRLCFVEFLFKFYEGGGRQYSPFKLKKRGTVLQAVKS